MEEKIKPGYWSVTPASVRYNDLVCPNAKLLYGELTALCNKEGYCWATNKYFSDLYKVQPRAVSDWVSQLVKAGFIRVEITDKVMRKIFIVEVGENSRGGTRKFTQEVRENSPHNNTFNNTKNIKGARAKKASEPEPLPDWMNKDAWREWEQHRREKKMKLTPLSQKKQIKFLEKFKKDHVAIINHSITMGWTGLFELDEKKALAKESGISEDAKKMVERMKQDRERVEGKREDSTNNEGLRKLNDQVKALGESKKVIPS